tara:strand:- start:1789 stop:2211 length:423 start_codon:yes stop_codon:yes gene_type:complete
MNGYTLKPGIPSVEDYLRLRIETGLSPHAQAAAQAGLPNSIVSSIVEFEDEVIGMGRVVGDGGLFFQVVDMAVQPAHQGKGVGKAIMHDLMARLARTLRAPAYVSLIADGEASHLYARNGFASVAPNSQGMARWLDPVTD